MSQTATFISTVDLDEQSNDKYIRNIYFNDAANGITAARLHGSGNKKERSEDSLFAVSNFNGGKPLAKEQTEQMMNDMVSEIRKAPGLEEYGGATLAGVMTCDAGIAFANIGDSCIFITNDKGEPCFQINTPQKSLPKLGNRDGRITNFLGKIQDKTQDRPREEEDEIRFKTWEEIRELVGDNARIVIASDGLTEMAKLQFKADDTVGDEINRAAYRQAIQNAQAGMCAELAKDQTTAEMFIRKSLNARAQGKKSDDISVITFALPPKNAQHIAAFVSDGMGGHGNGAKVSQDALRRARNYINSTLAENITITELAGQPFDVIWQEKINLPPDPQHIPRSLLP